MVLSVPLRVLSPRRRGSRTDSPPREGGRCPTQSLSICSRSRLLPFTLLVRQSPKIATMSKCFLLRSQDVQKILPDERVEGVSGVKVFYKCTAICRNGECCDLDRYTFFHNSRIIGLFIQFLQLSFHNYGMAQAAPPPALYGKLCMRLTTQLRLHVYCLSMVATLTFFIGLPRFQRTS